MIESKMGKGLQVSENKGFVPLIIVEKRKKQAKTVKTTRPLKVVEGELNDFGEEWPHATIIVEAGSYLFKINEVQKVIIPPYAKRRKKK